MDERFQWQFGLQRQLGQELDPTDVDVFLEAGGGGWDRYSKAIRLVSDRRFGCFRVGEKQLGGSADESRMARSEKRQRPRIGSNIGADGSLVGPVDGGRRGLASDFRDLGVEFPPSVL